MVLSGAHELPKHLAAHALLVLFYILFASIFHSCSTEIAIAVLSMGLGINLTELNSLQQLLFSLTQKSPH